MTLWCRSSYCFNPVCVKPILHLNLLSVFSFYVLYFHDRRKC